MARLAAAVVVCALVTLGMPPAPAAAWDLYVDSVVPTSGPADGGNTITVTGESLDTNANIAFIHDFSTYTEGVPASCTPTVCTATVPPGSGSVSLYFWMRGDSSFQRGSLIPFWNHSFQQWGYTYLPTPVITAVSPNQGASTGGTTVTINGSNLSGAIAVAFGGAAGSNVTVLSDSFLTAVAPAGTGTVDVQVTAPGGTSHITTADRFTYVDVGPGPVRVTALSKTAGPEAGGFPLTVTGTGFDTSGTTFTFGAAAATGVTCGSSTSCTVTVPAGTGTVDVVATSSHGTSTTSVLSKFTYVPAPTVTSLSPTQGPLGGGTTITVSGANFVAPLSVKFGANTSASVALTSPTQLTATLPAGAPGTVHVTVTTDGGTSATSAADQFTYRAAPTITALSTDRSAQAGGTTIVLTGTGFTGASAVTVAPTSLYYWNGGPVAAAAFTVDSDTQITMLTPPGTFQDAITVTTLGGTSNAASFIYGPAVTTFEGCLCWDNGGRNAKTIDGYGFTGATSVTVNGTPVSFAVLNDSQIRLTPPTGYDWAMVKVTTPLGTSPTDPGNDSCDNIYKPFESIIIGFLCDNVAYQVVIDTMTPSSGPSTGGQTVTLTGAGLPPTAGIFLGSESEINGYDDATATCATTFTCTFTTPAKTGTRQLWIDFITGPHRGTIWPQGEAYSFYPVPAITGITPSSGTYAGGDSVTIAGVNLTGASAVTFGSSNATSFTVNSDASITAVTPSGTGIVNVSVTTPGGPSAASGGSAFSYLNAPQTITFAQLADVPYGAPALTLTATAGSGLPVSYAASGACSVSGSTLTFTAIGTCTVSASQAGNAQWHAAPTVTQHFEVTDTVPPLVSASLDRAANGQGWYGAPVTATFTCSDAQSGIATCPAPVRLASDGADQTVTGTATDNAGNSASVTLSGINIDQTAPTITGAPDRAPNANGWYGAAVTVSFTCGDALSGVASCTPPTTDGSEGADQSVTGTATDRAGNSAAATVGRLNIDTTAPTISGAPDRAPNANGWYSAAVTVSFTCNDALSGVATCTPPTGDASDGADQAVTGIAVDRAGNVASATVSRINIDQTAPTITAAPDRAPNANGWYNAAVTVSFTCNDALSGVAMCTPPTTDASEGAGQSVTGDAVDRAGNSASATLGSLNIDKTAPTITAAPDRAPNANGWYDAPVTISFICGDALSGMSTCPAPITLATDGAAQSVSGTATDKAGNTATATASGINIDLTPPDVAAAPDRLANANGWYRTPLTVSFSCDDALSGVATCTPPTTDASEGADQSVTGIATDRAGNVSTVTLANINIDLTPPTISGAADRSPNAAGWYRASVTVSFTCADALSGIASCSVPVLLAQGAAQSVTGTATDNAGNTSSATVRGVNIDTTAPTVTYNGNAGSYTVDQTINITCTPADDLSGVASSTCAAISGPASAFAVGAHSYSATATDVAGNVGSGSTSFTIVVTATSLQNLTTTLVTDPVIASSLNSKLAAAQQSLANGNVTAANNQLAAYRNQLAAQSGKKISAQNAAQLAALSGKL